MSRCAEIPGRPGLYRFDLEGAPCLPGEFRLVRWGLDRPDACNPILDSKVEDALGARLLVYMWEDFKSLPTNTTAAEAAERLCWIGVSKTRLLEDNKISDERMDPDEVRVILARFEERGLIQVQETGGGLVYLPTLALIMKMVGRRRSLHKS